MKDLYPIILRSIASSTFFSFFSSYILMKNNLLLSCAFLLSLLHAQATTWTITDSGLEFSPNTLTITNGDTVNFTIASVHNAREVSQASWNANSSAALAGGFQTPSGGGIVLPLKLGVGTHFYVCPPHISGGMKGTIIVTAATGIAGTRLPLSLKVFPNPASDQLSIQADARAVGTRFYVLDAAGKQVQAGILASETTVLSLSGLAAGIFYLQVGEADKTTYTLLKQ